LYNGQTRWSLLAIRPQIAPVRVLSANSLSANRRILRLLIGFVFTTLCLGSVVALVIYADTHSDISSQDMVSHTQQVLLELQGVSQQLDRIELNARLYSLTSDENNVRAAQGATVTLNTLLLRLATLVRDNPEEERRARDLLRESNQLNEATDRLMAQANSVRDLVVNCRRILNPMQDEERTLLSERATEAERNHLYSLARRIATIAIGTILILILFGFLTRDAVRRERFEEQLSNANEQLRSTVQRLEERASESRLLISARDEVALCLEVSQAEASTVRYLAQLLPESGGSLCIVNNSRQIVETVSSWGEPRATLLEGFAPEHCCALRSGRMRWRHPDRSQVHCSHFLGAQPEHYLCFPLVAHGETLGILYIECPTAAIAAKTEAHEGTIASLGEMAAMAIAGLHLRQKLESQSIRDSLTGLFNRSFMEVALEREMHRAERRDKELALMMVDVDHFKQFNDSFGHEAGDVVLREVAECLRVSVRNEDVVCRFGGEEFVIILPETEAPVALERAELLRQTVSDLVLRYHGQPLRQVTISIGMAIFPRHANTTDELLRCADRALYAAKHRGRNRVIEADTSIPV